MNHLYLGRIIRTDELVICIECLLKPKNPQEDKKMKDFFTHFFDLYSSCQSVDYILRSLIIMFQSYEQEQIKVRWSGKKNGLMEISHNKLIKYEESKENIRMTYQNQEEKDQIKFETASINNYNELKSFMEDTILQVNALKNYQPVKNVTPAYNQIYKIYDLFYGKKPDFQEENIESQFQYMFAILCHFGISLDEIHFNQNSQKIPTSHYLKSMINSIRPYVDVQGIFEDVALLPDVAKRIQIIGQNISSATNERDKLKFLKEISQILYTKEWCLSSSASSKEIGKYLGIEPKNVDEVLQLKRKLNRKIEGE